jgi:hypothetical protein
MIATSNFSKVDLIYMTSKRNKLENIRNMLPNTKTVS